MTGDDRMTRLYQRIEDFGIDRKYVRAVGLPRGWKDRDAENPAAYSFAIGQIARNLNLDLRALQSSEAPLAWRDCGPTRFKKQPGVEDHELSISKCLAARAAQVACMAVNAPVGALPTSGMAIRDAIRENGLPCVTFEALLDYCWEHGIPLLHVARFPVGAKKPDALTGVFADRPAVVISKRHKSAAWFLFYLAHEMGHIALGHLQAGGLLVDQKIQSDSDDELEEEANRFAAETLTGRADIRYHAYNNLTAEQLAEDAREAGRRDGVDPGVIALNYAWNKSHYGSANLVLGLLELNSDPVAIIRAKMCERLNWQELPRDNRQFLRRITETDTAR